VPRLDAQWSQKLLQNELSGFDSTKLDLRNELGSGCGLAIILPD